MFIDNQLPPKQQMSSVKEEKLESSEKKKVKKEIAIEVDEKLKNSNSELGVERNSIES
jgi:hypothetical protein